MPQAGDDIVFEFHTPVALHGYRLRSGNHEHPSDLLYNTTVEIRPVDFERVKESLKISSSEKFIGVGEILEKSRGERMLYINLCIYYSGEFNDLGIAEGKIDASLFGPIGAVRLVIKSASKNWVIISEVRNFDLSFVVYSLVFLSRLCLTLEVDSRWWKDRIKQR